MNKILTILSVCVIAAANYLTFETKAESQVQQTNHFIGENLIIDSFCRKTAEELLSSMKDYPWQDGIWKGSLFEILNLFARIALFNNDTLENLDEKFLSSANKNFIVVNKVLTKIILENLNLESALNDVENKLKAGEYYEDSEDGYNATLNDVKIYLNPIDFKSLNKKINKIRDGYYSIIAKIPDYTQVLKLPQNKLFPVSKLEKKQKQKFLYGLYTTELNRQSGFYINQTKQVFQLPKYEKAKPAWEIFQASEHDQNELMEKARSTIKENNRRFEKTDIKAFDGTCLDAAIEYSRTQKISLVSLADGKTVGGGSLIGKMGQEEINCHCIAGLYYSLSPNEDVNLDKEIQYTKHIQSPESVMYSSEMTLIKRVQNGSFLTAEEPIQLDVISVAGIKFDSLESQKPLFAWDELKNIDPIEEIDHRIELMFLLAIKHNCDVLILGKFNLGNYNGDPKIIQKLYIKYKEKYNGYIKTIVLATGDKEPYAS